MLSSSNQLLLRNIELFDVDSILLVQPQLDDFIVEISSRFSQANIDLLHYFFAAHQQLSQQFPDVGHQLTGQLNTKKFYDLAVIYFPKSKAEFRYMLAEALPQLSPEGTLLIVGENHGGVKSCAKQLSEFCSQYSKVDTAKHCALFQALAPEQRQPFHSDSHLSSFSLQTLGLTIHSLPGVFSHGSLDAGTELLLQHIDESAKAKRIVDFGCGAGVISAALAQRYPEAEIIALDHQALAVQSVQHTMAANQLQATVMFNHQLQAISGSVDAIYSNPPFHSGQRRDFSVSEQFFQQAKQLLRPKGQLTLVANNFLPYKGMLSVYFNQVSVIAKSSRFQVLQAIA